MYQNNNKKFGNITINDKCYPTFIKTKQSKNGKCDIISFNICKLDENKNKIYSFNCTYLVYGSNQQQLEICDKNINGETYKCAKPIKNISGQGTINNYNGKTYNNLLIKSFEPAEQTNYSYSDIIDVNTKTPTTTNKELGLSGIDEEEKNKDLVDVKEIEF